MQECDYLLYVITPEQKGFSAIASAIDYSNKTPERVLFCVLYEWGDKKFEGHPLESINCVKDMIKDNGGKNIRKFRTNRRFFKFSMLNNNNLWLRRI